MVTTKPIPFYAFNFIALSLFAFVMIIGLYIYFQSQNIAIQLSPDAYSYEDTAASSDTSTSDTTTSTESTTTENTTANTTKPKCGDKKIEGNEICDANSQSCVKNEYTGTQICNTKCDGWNTCITTKKCGDKIKNGPEECDGTDFGKDSGDLCALGYINPPTCDASCTIVCLKAPSKPTPAPIAAASPPVQYPIIPPFSSCNNANPDIPCISPA